MWIIKTRCFRIQTFTRIHVYIALQTITYYRYIFCLTKSKMRLSNIAYTKYVKNLTWKLKATTKIKFNNEEKKSPEEASEEL